MFFFLLSQFTIYKAHKFKQAHVRTSHFKLLLKDVVWCIYISQHLIIVVEIFFFRNIAVNKLADSIDTLLSDYAQSLHMIFSINLGYLVTGLVE